MNSLKAEFNEPRDRTKQKEFECGVSIHMTFINANALDTCLFRLYKRNLLLVRKSHAVVSNNKLKLQQTRANKLKFIGIFFSFNNEIPQNLVLKTCLCYVSGKCFIKWIYSIWSKKRNWTTIFTVVMFTFMRIESRQHTKAKRFCWSVNRKSKKRPRTH